MDYFGSRKKMSALAIQQKELSPVEQPTSRLDVAGLVCFAAVLSLYVFA